MGGVEGFLKLFISFIVKPISQHQFILKVIKLLFLARTTDNSLFAKDQKVDDERDFDEIR